jgi:hypothetical protein
VPPEPLVFFVDRSLGRHFVPEAPRGLGASLEIHDDHFDKETKDADWIASVAGRGWVILTKDRRIRYGPLERAAVFAANARMFALTGGNLSGPEMAAVLTKQFEKMSRIAKSEPPPFIARISHTGIILNRLRS